MKNKPRKAQNRTKCCRKTATCLKSPTIPTSAKQPYTNNTFHPYRAVPTGDTARRSKRPHRYKRGKQVNQREIKQSIKNNPALTASEKVQKLNELRMPYKKMTDEELLQLVRDFTKENGREPMQADVLYDRELKQRFGPWNRMLERAGTRPVAQSYLDKKRRRKEKRQRHKEYRRQIREQAAAEAEQGASAATEAAIHQ